MEGGGAREEQRDARRVVRKVKTGGPKPCDVRARDVDLNGEGCAPIGWTEGCVDRV